MKGGELTKREEAIFAYIAALEDVNDQLMKSLEKSMEVMEQFSHLVPDPVGWQQMLDTFQEIIKAGERVVSKKTLH